MCVLRGYGCFKDSMNYPKRLIEVDLPIKRISAHARREKSIRHGHISTLHIWWARRPLASCRAVICASLWPDPADPLCPSAFRKAAAAEMTAFAKAVYQDTDLTAICDGEAWKRYGNLARRKTPLDLKTLPVPRKNGEPRPDNPTDLELLRELLLDFIADFAAWESSTNATFLTTARNLTQAAHEALGGAPGTRPLVVDPFAGGGAIPLEALRVGADAFASDLNPVAVLLNKVVLEYIPKYGQKLADEVRKWGQWVKEQAEKELARFYPKDADGATPIAYLWARTIKCEGPGCGAEVPLMRSLWLAKKASRSVALKIAPNPGKKRVDFEIIQDAKAKDVGEGTVRRGSATCLCCGFTTPVASVRVQMKARKGGAHDARLFAVVTTHAAEQGRFYRLPTDADLKAVRAAAAELENRKVAWKQPLALVPDEPLPPQGTLGFRVQLYGMLQWGDLFTPRQLLSLTTLGRHVREAGQRLSKEHDPGLAEAVQSIFSLAVSRLTDIGNSLCSWKPSMSQVIHVFTRQAIPMLWDFAEASVLSDAAGDFTTTVDNMCRILDRESNVFTSGHVEQSSAMQHSLPDDAASAFITDPPYYDAVPYSDLSDFFYVWLKRTLPPSLSASFSEAVSPKRDECIVDEVKEKDRAYFEAAMAMAMGEGRRVMRDDGVGLIVFAHKSTAGWEAQLQAMVDAGWIITGSWPIDTEMGNRLRAMDSAALASSVHLVCRPRINGDAGRIGDWRDVLAELPKRIHDWMPRLAAEGVVGADAIFACIGPALEVFSRYSRVEKANGEKVTLKEYLEYVWAAVAQEALKMVFEGADASGFEEDSRLTAIWLWTLFGGVSGDLVQSGADEDAADGEAADTDEEDGGKTKKGGGYVLEYDAARKIAQGLGAHLVYSTTFNGTYHAWRAFL
jgi:putative DNA methylase